MFKNDGKHPLATAPGILALAAWSMYVLGGGYLYYPAFLASVLIAGFFGLVACVAVIANFKYWRSAVVLASSVYLVLYVIKVIRMTGMTADTPFLSAISFYYGALWQVGLAMFQERGYAGGLTQGFLEYVMPVLVIALIPIVLVSRRPKPGDSRTG